MKFLIEKKYFYIKVISAKTTYKGYIQADSVYFQLVRDEKAVSKATATPSQTETPTKTTKPEKTEEPTKEPEETQTPSSEPETTAEFKKSLKKAGFPDDYITELANLHENIRIGSLSRIRQGLNGRMS